MSEYEPWFHDALVEHHTKAVHMINAHIEELEHQREWHELELDKLNYSTPENVDEPT